MRRVFAAAAVVSLVIGVFLDQYSMYYLSRGESVFTSMLDAQKFVAAGYGLFILSILIALYGLMWTLPEEVPPDLDSDLWRGLGPVPPS